MILISASIAFYRRLAGKVTYSWRAIFVALPIFLGSSASAALPCSALFQQKPSVEQVQWNLSSFAEALSHDWSPWIGKTIEVVPRFQRAEDKNEMEKRAFGATFPVKQKVLKLNELAGKTGDFKFKERLASVLILAHQESGSEFGFVAAKSGSTWTFSNVFRGQRDHNIPLETITAAVGALLEGMQKDQKVDLILVHNHPTSSPVNGIDWVASKILLQILKTQGFTSLSLETIAVGNQVKPGFEGPPVFALELTGE